MKAKAFALTLLVSILVSCTIEPAKIEYGKDACHFCKMNIVDKTHASQLVTKKGKAFKYDAIECMLNDLENRNQKEIGLFLITDYLTPEKLINAKEATFLISDSIQSPMGANLTGFEVKNDAINITKENNNGKVYDWLGIQQHFYND